MQQSPSVTINGLSRYIENKTTRNLGSYFEMDEVALFLFRPVSGISLPLEKLHRIVFFLIDFLQLMLKQLSNGV